jgi:AcrR family transcriptional regulator
MTAVTGPGENTRSKILDVALELIAERGFAGTSTRELAERLGFTKAALYYHFRTKDDLLAALAAPSLAELASLAGASPQRPTASGRRALLRRYIDHVASHQRLIRVLSHDPSAAASPALAEAPELFRQVMHRLSGDPADPAARARARFALGGIHAAVLNADPDDDPQAVRAAALAAACGAVGLPVPRAAAASE